MLLGFVYLLFSFLYYDEIQGHQQQQVRSRRNRRYVNGDESINGETVYGRRDRNVYLIETVAVVDKTLFEKYDRDRELVTSRIHLIISLTDHIYHDRNIRILLSDVIIWEDENKFEITDKSNVTIDNANNFLVDIRARSPEDSVWNYPDVFVVFSGIKFDHDVLGTAFIHTLCDGDTAIAMVTDITDDESYTSLIAAHEIGHIIGLLHNPYLDAEENIKDPRCWCGDADHCIMDSMLDDDVGSYAWSDCSRTVMERIMDSTSCVSNIPHPSHRPVCGNHVVEEGEECDCGLPRHCQSNCCDPHTCKLLPHADCEVGECCSGLCQFQPSQFVCRPTGNSVCDLPETCTGTSAWCPEDMYVRDGALCTDVGPGTCQNKECGSIDALCSTIFNSEARGAESWAWNFNGDGLEVGNCGIREDGTFIPCSQENKHCGSLWCSHLTDVMVTTRASRRYESTFHKMVMSVVPRETHERRWARNGSICGHDDASGRHKICRNFECVDHESDDCEGKCNGNGVCNNKGNCHCNEGTAPPFCQYPGRGGSVDLLPQSVEVEVEVDLCGDGIVQGSEDCDCGEDCEEQPCCVGATCKFRTVGFCRDSVSDCDVTEYCTGDSAYCPADQHFVDGSPCDDDKGYCYMGMCKSHERQCKFLYGRTASVASDACYDENRRHGRVGNCGQKTPGGRFRRCNIKNQMCGKLWCVQQWTDSQKAYQARNIREIRFPVEERRTSNGDKCLALRSLRRGRHRRPDDERLLVEDGAKCGENKMCVDQRCRSIRSPEECRQCIKDGGSCSTDGSCHPPLRFRNRISSRPTFGGK